MDCPLCNTPNDAASTQCMLCDTPLATQNKQEAMSESMQPFSEPIELESVDVTSFYAINWRRLSIFFVMLLIAAVPWLSNTDLLQLPTDVVQEREKFSLLLQSYQAKAEYWDVQKHNIETAMQQYKTQHFYFKPALVFNDIPPEVFCSYLLHEAQFSQPQFHSVTLTPLDFKGREHRFLLTKERSQWGPLRMVAALELALVPTVGHHPHIEFKALRCGSRQLPTSLAWSYFASELQALRCMEDFSGGVHHFQMMPQNTTGNDVASQIVAQTFSWIYQHDPLLAEGRTTDFLYK